MSTTLLSLYYPSLRAKFWDQLPGAVLPNITDFAPRQVLLTTLMALWSARLGYFLVTVSNPLSRIVDGDDLTSLTFL